MDVAFAIVILRRRESEGGRGKKSGLAEGWRMTGSAFKAMDVLYTLLLAEKFLFNRWQ